jgi:hypothetical protein
MGGLPLKTWALAGSNWPFFLAKMWALQLTFCALAGPSFAQEDPPTDKGYEREELGVNTYTAPLIERVFEQLDQLKPFPFQEAWRDLASNTSVPREQRGIIFGCLLADGFIIVEAEKQSAIADLARVLMKEARGLGVGDRVMRHSASLTELGRGGRWPEVRRELIATQADVEQAMLDLRDQKMAHLISLGGWLRGLDICAGAVEANFSPARAKVLEQPELVDYFNQELNTLPPSFAHAPLFEKLRSGVKAIKAILLKAGPGGLQPADVKALHAEAQQLHRALRRAE